MLRYSDAIIFIDLHQLAYTDMLHKETEAIQILDDIDYYTTIPTQCSIRQAISPDNLCVVQAIAVAFCSTLLSIRNRRLRLIFILFFFTCTQGTGGCYECSFVSVVCIVLYNVTLTELNSHELFVCLYGLYCIIQRVPHWMKDFDVRLTLWSAL